MRRGTHISLNLFELNSKLEWRTSSMKAKFIYSYLYFVVGIARNWNDNQFGELFPNNFGGFKQRSLCWTYHATIFLEHFCPWWPSSHLFNNCKLFFAEQLHLFCLIVLTHSQSVIGQGTMLWIRQSWLKNCVKWLVFFPMDLLALYQTCAHCLILLKVHSSIVCTVENFQLVDPCWKLNLWNGFQRQWRVMTWVILFQLNWSRASKIFYLCKCHLRFFHSFFNPGIWFTIQICTMRALRVYKYLRSYHLILEVLKASTIVHPGCMWHWFNACFSKYR